MNRVFLGVGSNIDPEINITKGFKLLLKSGCTAPPRGEGVLLSTHYRTPPLKGRSDPDFINGVWQFDSPLALAELRSVLKKIEGACGRGTNSDPYGPRPLDFDLLLYGEMEDRAANLPHPDIYSRPFVYIPLLELSPDITLPGDTQKLSAIVDTSAKPVVISPLTEELRTLQKTGAV